MITAVDTNVLLDVFLADAAHGPASRDRLKECLRQGAVVICEVAYAEFACAFGSRPLLDGTLRELGIELEPSRSETLWKAAELWRSALRRSGSAPSKRILPDFLVGAHAARQADRLLTRDRGFYREYFKGLEVLAP